MNETFALNMRQAGNALRAVYARELAAYFLTPLAYVFIAIFLIALAASSASRFLRPSILPA